MTAMDSPSGNRQEGPEAAPPVEDRVVVLLVEDDAVDRELYGRLLWYNGYSVLHAADGESAIALALDARPDLILLDMMLEGELSGLDVAERLRDEGLGVPMIALSAIPRKEFGAAIEEAGITAYLEKPIDPFEVVKEVLRRTGNARPPEAPPSGGVTG